MKTSWIVGAWIVFLGGNLLSGVLEQQYLGGSAGTSQVFNSLMNTPIVTDFNLLTLPIDLVLLAKDLFLALIQMLLWNYAFFTGGWEIVRWFLFAISVGIIVSTIMAIRGTGSS